MEEDVNDIKPSGSDGNEQKNNAKVLKPEESQTRQLPEKGVINKAMHYEAAMTSPTELLAPDVFPDEITDMNGNAMSDKHETKVEFQTRRSNVRYLLWLVVFLITATLIMTALFTWKMTETDDPDESTVEVRL